MAKALDDIRVLDFTRFVAGPTCSIVLTDLGAEVIKVEIPEGGDASRGIPPFTKGLESGFFINLNRGKKSITLNLTTERGRRIAVELAEKVDVLVENFSPGVMDRLGLGYEELARFNPGLIYASSSGFGHTGPRSSGLAFDIVAQSTGGLMSVTGFPDGPPTKVGPAVSDSLGGFHTAMAIMAALHYRSRTGEGQRIDISMQDCVWSVTAIEYAPFYFLDNEVPKRFGNSAIEAVPYGTYPAKDDYIIIACVTIGQWEGLLRAIGKEDLIGVPKYSTQAERVNYRDEVDLMVSEWTKTKTVEEIMNALTNVGVPCSLVATFDQVANDPQLLSREMIVEVEQPISGKVKVPGSVFKMSKTPGEVKLPAPFLGEHNYEIYSDVLGYNEQEIRKLADDGII
ncbi:CaiB/BaiF CoA transferase family protein [Chloroflexota bacterium]